MGRKKHRKVDVRVNKKRKEGKSQSRKESLEERAIRRYSHGSKESKKKRVT